jgi:dTDP-4-dehydrorhamnose reductase
MRQLVLVAGAGGQLGRAMADQLGAKHEVVAYTRADLDLTDAADVHRAVLALCPDVIVNCAAYTDVDGAEKDPAAALSTNAWGVRALARVASDLDATLVHYSTDFVFDGTGDHPYLESDAPNPKSTYAMSKLLGEWFALETPKHYVLRVESLFGGEPAHSSIDRIAQRLRAGDEVRAFLDRTVSPSFVDDVVSATMTALERQIPYGVYHCVNSGHTTWVGLARAVAALIGQGEGAIVPIRMADANLIASRPLRAALSNEKLAAAGVPMPTWQDALRRYLVDEPNRRAAEAF